MKHSHVLIVFGIIGGFLAGFATGGRVLGDSREKQTLLRARHQFRMFNKINDTTIHIGGLGCTLLGEDSVFRFVKTNLNRCLTDTPSANSTYWSNHFK